MGVNPSDFLKSHKNVKAIFVNPSGFSHSHLNCCGNCGRRLRKVSKPAYTPPVLTIWKQTFF